MGNKNRKVTKAEKAKAVKVIKEAYPDYEVVFGLEAHSWARNPPRRAFKWKLSLSYLVLAPKMDTNREANRGGSFQSSGSSLNRVLR